jgi:hypothetical protein
MPVINDVWQSDRSRKKEQDLMKGVNAPNQASRGEMEPPRYFIYIHSVSPVPFDDKHYNAINHALLPPINLKAADPKNGLRYTTWNFPIRHRFPQRVEDVFSTGRDPFDYHDAWRIAQDICDPANPTGDQTIEHYEARDPYFAVQEGTKCAEFGVFWSRNEVPTEDELQFAEARRDRTIEARIRRADQLIGEKGNAGLAQITWIDRLLLDFAGESRDWHKRFVRMRACPNCGIDIPIKAGFHFINGKPCVNDWRAAVNSGIKTIDEVPAEVAEALGLKRGRPRQAAPETAQ